VAEPLGSNLIPYPRLHMQNKGFKSPCFRLHDHPKSESVRQRKIRRDTMKSTTVVKLCYSTARHTRRFFYNTR